MRFSLMAGCCVYKGLENSNRHHPNNTLPPSLLTQTPLRATIVKLIPITIPLTALFFAASVTSIKVKVTQDPRYGNQVNPGLNPVACALKNGVKINGIIIKDFNHFEDIPNYPDITGASFVNKDLGQCGSCYELTHHNQNKTYVTVVDATNDGFNAAPDVVAALIGQDAANMYQGVDGVDATLADPEKCGFRRRF